MQDPVPHIKGHGFYPKNNHQLFCSFKFRSHKMMRFMCTIPANRDCDIYLCLKTILKSRSLYSLSLDTHAGKSPNISIVNVQMWPHYLSHTTIPPLLCLLKFSDLGKTIILHSITKFRKVEVLINFCLSLSLTSNLLKAINVASSKHLKPAQVFSVSTAIAVR